MSTTILVIGLMVFFAHFLSLQFRKTNIPDVLVLMLAGILLGPVFGVVTPQDFGKIGSANFKNIDKSLVPLNEIDLVFYRESVFLLKTYFFVYLGISIHFGAAHLALMAVLMTVLVFAMRTGLTRFVYRDAAYTLRDTVITSMMAPKGLAAAVLAGLPLQYGVAGGETIRDTTYMVVLVSIALCTLLVAVYLLPGMQKLYSHALGKPVIPKIQET